jgi:hypothetical protein
MSTNAGRSKRTKLYETAIACLLSETTIIKASAKCGISSATMSRWMKEPEFIKLYDASKGLVLESVKNQLRQLGERAVATLGNVIDSNGAADSDKLNAAKFVVNSLLNFQVTDELTIKIQQLEANNSEEG